MVVSVAMVVMVVTRKALLLAQTVARVVPAARVVMWKHARLLPLQSAMLAKVARAMSVVTET